MWNVMISFVITICLMDSVFIGYLSSSVTFNLEKCRQWATGSNAAARFKRQLILAYINQLTR